MKEEKRDEKGHGSLLHELANIYSKVGKEPLFYWIGDHGNRNVLSKALQLKTAHAEKNEREGKKEDQKEKPKRGRSLERSGQER